MHNDTNLKLISYKYPSSESSFDNSFSGDAQRPDRRQKHPRIGKGPNKRTKTEDYLTEMGVNEV